MIFIKNSKTSISVAGSSGFIGNHLLNFLSKRNDVEIRALITEKHERKNFIEDDVTIIEGNLKLPETLNGFVSPGGTVVNLVHLKGRSKDENLKAMNNLAEVCTKNKIKRLIHCSTAVVVGRVPDEIIDENTKPNPRKEYEKTKLSVERLFLNKYGDSFEVVILRPTGVFGPGGQNLLKMANDLSRGKKFKNYLKSCLFNQRKMNLVYIDNVISAIVFLIDTPQNIGQEIFIISDDEYQSNNYRDIEKHMIKRFGYKDYYFPRFPTSSVVLSFLLRMYGKSNLNPNSIYDCRKILNAGFKKPVLFKEALDYFTDWYKEIIEKS